MSVPLQVHGTALAAFGGPVIGRVTPQATGLDRRDHELLCDQPASDPAAAHGASGWTGMLCAGDAPGPWRQAAAAGLPAVEALRYTSHLEEGDIVSLHANGYVRTLYRRASRHNAIFATDRCNSLCLMCSQPPRPSDDRGRVAEHLRLIELIDVDCPELGITGGEPTLLGRGLLHIIRRCKEQLPITALHMLTNGRLFSQRGFAEAIAAVEHPDLMLGIPLYAAVPWAHDHVVQAKGAWRETVLGLLELGRAGVHVEIRIVVHRLTVDRLGRLADFIYRNLPFAAHVAFMGLEMMGFAAANRKQLWIDPYDTRHALEEAVLHLAHRGMAVSIYNYPLCLLPRDLWPYARQSISDWKNDYATECEGCAVRDRCSGFFTSTLRRAPSAHIQPIGSDPGIDLL